MALRDLRAQLSSYLCLGILLSLLGHLVLNEFFGGIPMQFTVSAAGIAIMISVAALMEWFGAAQARVREPRPWGADGGKRSTRMTPALLRYVIVAVSLGLLPSPVEAFSQERDCPVPERFYAFDPSLTKTVKALVSSREVVIAVLGGSSTLGLAAGAPSLAWPARLAAVLAKRFPSARIKVVNLAVARQTAKAAGERLSRDVLPLSCNAR